MAHTTERCVISLRVSGACSACGSHAEPAHLPDTRLGVFCVACCPTCRPLRPAFDDRMQLEPTQGRPAFVARMQPVPGDVPNEAA
jgi:hypothetical protein